MRDLLILKELNVITATKAVVVELMALEVTGYAIEIIIKAIKIASVETAANKSRDVSRAIEAANKSTCANSSPNDG